MRIAAVALLVVTGPVVAAGQGGVGSDAVTRVQQAARSAIGHSPRLKRDFALLAAEQATAAARAAPGSPYVELQTEGFDSSLDRSANAQDTLRVGSPFNYPWHAGSTRDLREAAARRASAGHRAATLQLMSTACARWLELAAATERWQVVSRRLGRLDRVLALHEERLRLGEVSGTAVSQLDLAHIQVSARLAELDSQRRVALQLLQEASGAEVSTPRSGDLSVLVTSTRSPTEGSPPDEGLVASPFLEAATTEADLATAMERVVAATAWGRPEAEAEWEHFPAIDGLAGYDAFGLRLSLPLPLGAAGREDKAVARAEARAAESAADALRLELERRVLSAISAASSAERRLQALRPAIGRLDTMEHSLGEQFRLDVLTYVAYIDGLSRLDDIRLDGIAARADLLAARLEIAVLLDDPTLFPLPDTSSAPEATQELP